MSDQLQSALGAAYRIERELGGGGMSRVFLATEVGLKRPRRGLSALRSDPGHQ